MIKLPSAEELWKLYQSNMSIAAIAEKYGASQGGIQNKLRRAGYKLRGLSEAHKLAFATGRKVPKSVSGEKHWMWRGGTERRSYRGKVKKEECKLCQVTTRLEIHHKDFDHYNNDPDNLEVLCVTCHRRLHKKAYWDAIKAGIEPPRSNGPIGWERDKKRKV